PIVFAVYWVTLALAALADARRAGPLTRRGWLSRMGRAPFWDAAVVAGVFLAHLVFRLAVYDGEWLPNTYYAKHGGFWPVTPWKYVGEALTEPFLGPIGLLAAAAGLALARPRSLWPVAAIFAAGFALPFLTGT